MEYLFKFMMLIVVIPIIFLLFVFAARHMPNPTLEYQQEFNGGKVDALHQIEDLCDSCLSRNNFNRDCFLLKLNIKDKENISQKDFSGYKKYKININNSLDASGNILEDYSEIKISSFNNTCRLRVLKQGKN